MLKNGEATVSDRMAVAMFCRSMRWTYQEYLSQPKWLIERIEVIARESNKGQ